MLLSSPPSAACRCCRHPCFPRYAVRYICVVPLVSYPGVLSCPIEVSQVFWFLFSSGPSSSSPLSPSRPFFSTVLLVHLCTYRGVYGGHDMRARERLASFGFGGLKGGEGGGRSGRSGPVLTTGLHRFVPEQRCGSSSFLPHRRRRGSLLLGLRRGAGKQWSGWWCCQRDLLVF